MPKYDGLRKLERNKALIEYAEQHRDLSLKEIGLIFGISGSRVSRLLNRRRADASTSNGR